jgi:hypothetical protein
VLEQCPICDWNRRKPIQINVELGKDEMRRHLQVHRNDNRPFACQMGCTMYNFQSEVARQSHYDIVHCGNCNYIYSVHKYEQEINPSHR